MSEPAQTSSFDSARVIIPALAISAIGALFYNLLPLFLGVAQDFRQLGNREIGFISSAFFLGYNAVTIWAFFWIRRWNWRKVTLVFLPLAMLALFVGSEADSYPLLLLGTAVAGGGFAAIYGVGTTILADTSNPARWYGVKIAMEAFPGAVLLFVLPGTLVPEYGLMGVVYGMLIVCVLLSPLLLTMPAQGRQELEEFPQSPAEDELDGIDSTRIWSALAATLLFFTAASGVWAFLERMGNQLGFEQGAIGILLSITLLFATLGSLLTAWLGVRLGNVRPFYASGLLFLVGLVLFSSAATFAPYAAAACLSTFAIGMGLPFAIAEVAELDVDGRFVILSVPAIGLGAMIGPGVAGMLADEGSYLPLLSCAAGALCLSMVLMWISSGKSGDSSAATALD